MEKWTLRRGRLLRASGVVSLHRGVESLIAISPKGELPRVFFSWFYTVVANKLPDLIFLLSARECVSGIPTVPFSLLTTFVFLGHFTEEGLVVLLLSPCHVGEVLYYTIQCNTSTRRVEMVSCFFLLLHTNCMYNTMPCCCFYILLSSRAKLPSPHLYFTRITQGGASRTMVLLQRARSQCIHVTCGW